MHRNHAKKRPASKGKVKKRPATLPVPTGCIEEQLEHIASKHGFVLSQNCLRETKLKDSIQRGCK